MAYPKMRGLSGRGLPDRRLRLLPMPIAERETGGQRLPARFARDRAT
jgi:hypothetical protein